MPLAHNGHFDENGRHDYFCIEFGHDAFCPDTAPSIVPFDPKTGQWLKGASGNLYGPKRLRAAREYIASVTGNGKTLLDKLMEIGGLMPAAGGEFYTGPVKVRALIKLADIFYGKQISGKVTGDVKHHVEVTTPQVTHEMSKFSTDELEALDRFYALQSKREAKPAQLDGADAITDAEFEEAQ